MAWTTPTTRATGYLVLASDWNNELVNNMKYLHGDSGNVDLQTGAAAYSFVQTNIQTVVAFAAAANSAYRNYFSLADAQPALQVLGSGQYKIGPGGSTAPDTSFNRSAAGRIKVNDVEAETKVAASYSSSITLDASVAKWHTITATNTTAFTINAPTNAPSASETQDLTIEIVNSSGGVIGDITWNTIFRPLTGSPASPVNYSKPVNGSKRACHFRWNGAAWVSVNANSIDYT